jgi:flagellar export protein FliJ
MERKESILTKTEEEYQTLLSSYNKFQKKGISVADLLHYENRLVWLKERKSELHRDLNLAKEKVERKRQVVVGRSRDKKVLEQLKARQDDNWRRYLEKKETAHLDEISVIAHQRKERHN